MKTQQEAIAKAMDYLAMRDHSRSELRMKLSKHDFLPDDVEAAITHAETAGWMLPPQAMAEKVAGQLNQKKKSHEYILKYLQQKQFPPVPRDGELELQKALSLLEGRFSTLSNLSTLDKKQVMVFLHNRGFDQDTIERVLNEAPGSSQSI